MLAANCHTLVTEWSTLAYVGLALGKPTYSYRDLEAHRALLPEQHGRAAHNIAAVCRDVMARRGTASRLRAPAHHPDAAGSGMKVTVVIQARTGSTRLPGKVLLPAAGAPLLARMVERVCAARTPGEVVIATTELADDDAICRDRPARRRHLRPRPRHRLPRPPRRRRARDSAPTPWSRSRRTAR